MSQRFVRVTDIASTFGDAVMLGMAMRDAEPGIIHPTLEIEPYVETDEDGDRWVYQVTYYGATLDIEL